MGTQERRANQTGSHSVARKRAKCTKGSKGNSMQANKDEDFNKDESGRGAGKPWDFPGTASHLLTPTCRNGKEAVLVMEWFAGKHLGLQPKTQVYGQLC